jgi:hypothetical protein
LKSEWKSRRRFSNRSDENEVFQGNLILKPMNEHK